MGEWIVMFVWVGFAATVLVLAARLVIEAIRGIQPPKDGL